MYLQLLMSPRLSSLVRAAAPQMEGTLVYLRSPSLGEVAVRATGEIPSATRAVGGAHDLASGGWDDDDGGRRWSAPSAQELRHDIDHFHETPVGELNRESWGEWHYFNVPSADGRRWSFLTFLVGGDVPNGDWGGQLLLTLHEAGRPARWTLPGARDFVSGYAVAGLRAYAAGSICVGARCERYDGAQSYHDHNYGTWRGVTWDWGAARAGSYTLLYGKAIAPDSLVADSPLSGAGTGFFETYR